MKEEFNMNILNYITFKELNNIRKLDKVNRLFVSISKNNLDYEFELFSWKDIHEEKSYVVQGSTPDCYFFESRNYDKLEDALDFIAYTISTNYRFVRTPDEELHYYNILKNRISCYEIVYKERVK